MKISLSENKNKRNISVNESFVRLKSLRSKKIAKKIYVTMSSGGIKNVHHHKLR
jgi:hypothetical protein